MTDAGSEMGNGKHLITAGRSANWHSHCGNQCGSSSKNSKWIQHMAHYTTLGHISKRLIYRCRNTSSNMSIAIPFTVDRNRNSVDVY